MNVTITSIPPSGALSRGLNADSPPNSSIPVDVPQPVSSTTSVPQDAVGVGESRSQGVEKSAVDSWEVQKLGSLSVEPSKSLEVQKSRSCGAQDIPHPAIWWDAWLEKLYHCVTLLGAMIIVCTASDLLTKYFVFQAFGKQDVLVVIPGFLRFEKILNSGGTLGLFQGSNQFFLGVSILAVAYVVVILLKYGCFQAPSAVALGLLISGAWGNGYDRLVYGGVRDFISFYAWYWPVFNLADVFIVGGLVLLIWGPCYRKLRQWLTFPSLFC